jgi:hypothetical protein
MGTSNYVDSSGRVTNGSPTRFVGDEFFVDGSIRGGNKGIIVEGRNALIGGDIRGGNGSVTARLSNRIYVSGSVIGENGGVSLSARFITILKDVIGRYLR